MDDAQETAVYAAREKASPAAASFEGGGAALTALLLVSFLSAVLGFIAYFLVDPANPELGS